MKSKYFLFALSAFALTACSSEDVVNDVTTEQNAITFDNVVNKLSRAEGDLTKKNLNHFNVFGYYTTPNNPLVAVPVFEDVDVTLKTISNKWEYDVPRYWVENGHYYFFAYSCGSVSKIDTETYKDISFSMDMKDGIEPSARVLIIQNYLCDYSHQHDLIYASNVGGTEDNPWNGIVASAKGNPDVAFEFKHLLSKVNAQFTSKFPAGYEVSISNVSLQNIRNQGSYNPTGDGAWQNVIRKYSEAANWVYLLNTEDKDVEPIVATVDKEGKETSPTTPYAFVIPYLYSTSASDADDPNVYLSFHIQVTNKKEIIFEQDMLGQFHPNWAAGYQYTYNVEVSGGTTHLQPITFTTTVTDQDGNVKDAVMSWANGNDDPTVTIPEEKNETKN